MPAFDASKHPLVVLNVIGEGITIISDPDCVQDFFTSQNKNIDKHSVMAEIFDPMFKNVFPFMATNEKWRVMRKAISHAFYKERI